jgi:hydroxymethylpyrimidine pyrophosphatase-like HAD family hydrolase
VAIATGRRYEFARAIFERLPAPLTLILSNGAIVKWHDGRTARRPCLARRPGGLAGAPEHRSSAALIFDRPREGQVVFESIDWNDERHRRFYEANRAFVSEHSPLEAALTEDPVQVMFTGRCAAMRGLFERLGAVATAAASNEAYSVTLTEYEHRDFSLVDVVQAGCSKGAALAGGRASGPVAGRGDGGWRQPERPRDARVRRDAGRDGQCRRSAPNARLGGHVVQ